MKIFCEDTLTYGAQFFNDVADVTWFAGNQLQPDQLKQADALFVRSTTKVNEALLSNAPNLKLVATATSGSDHMDLNFLQQRNIRAYAAGGCNAIAVAEYVIAGILYLAATHNMTLDKKTLGIVGAGHVGTALAQRAVNLGLKVVLCDPPLENAGDAREFASIEDILGCDIISLHVPFISSGDWPTKHMMDKARLQQLRPDQILINACRGEVVDNQALLELLNIEKRFMTVFDVWENEPAINFELARLTDIATEHIAGHSLEGKARGTEMVYKIAAEEFNWPGKSMWDYLPSTSNDNLQVDLTGAEPFHGPLHKLVRGVYDIHRDSERFRSNVSDREQFRYSRKNYAIRREFASIKVNAGNSSLSKAIYGLGFSQVTNN